MYTVNSYGECVDLYVNLAGQPITRTPQTDPYNYEEFVTWRGDYSATDSGVYSDRMYQWDSAKFTQCVHEVWDSPGQSFADKNPKDVEKFLSLYLGHPVRLTAIVQGCNFMSGFPYWAFCYRSEEEIR